MRSDTERLREPTVRVCVEVVTPKVDGQLYEISFKNPATKATRLATWDGIAGMFKQLDVANWWDLEAVESFRPVEIRYLDEPEDDNG